MTKQKPATHPAAAALRVGLAVLAASTLLTDALSSEPTAAETAPRPAVFALDSSAATAFREGKRWQVDRFPLPGGRFVALDLEPFKVVREGARLVLGSRDGVDRPLDFDPASVRLFRGTVCGVAGSHVFLALSESGSTGSIDLGPGGGRYRVATLDDDTKDGALGVFRTETGPGLPPDVPACSMLDEGFEPPTPGATIRGGSPASPPPIKHLELAVDTDHEFFLLFDDADAAMSYLVAMYAEVSAIFLRDTNIWVDLVFVRLWEDANDLYNDVDPSPIQEFRSEWNFNMGGVGRDSAQLVSGRRDYPFGGQAYLASLCGGNQYSVVGYMQGRFPDPSRPHPLTYDIAVTAHELAHVAGTGHTHDSGNLIDSCQDPATTPQRGTIMSYCAQTWSGGNSNRDLYFHSVIQQNIEDYVATAACVVNDCNFNSTDDTLDIQGGAADLNGNGVPDGCEDCNGNSVLDDADITAGVSFDLNANGLPDECEPDCDADDVPDTHQIALGSSTDAYGNDIPDECEPDCDSDGTSDFTELQLDMPLDLDRDTVLDDCQDCDLDGINDLVELSGRHGVWVTSGEPGSELRAFYASTGVLTAVSSGGAGATVDQGQDLIVTADHRVLVSSGGDNRVMEFDLDGNYLDDLVDGATGGLVFPTGLLLRPGGTLLVASRDSNDVREFDAVTGTPLGPFILHGMGGLVAPTGLTLGANGNLFVASASNEILEFDGQTGLFVGAFVSAAANGGLDQPRGLAFKPDGNLLVASYGTDEVLEFEAGSGAPLGKWAQVGTATRLTQVSPWSVRVGPNGNVFVSRTGDDFPSGSAGSLDDQHDDHVDNDIVQAGIDALHLTNAQIYEFNVRNGDFVRTHIGGNDHGLVHPTGFDFVPGWDLDCNMSLLTDDCDLSLGLSQDQDGNGAPDECDIDCNSNGVLDRLDVIPFGTGVDANYNLRPDECDCFSTAECDDGLSCTTDSCDLSTADCASLVVAGSCRIADTCYSTGDSNPANDCEVCDGGLPEGWTAAPPTEVQALVVTRAAGTDLSWAGQQPTTLYDVAGGAVAELAADGGVASATCLATGLTATGWSDPRADPTAGAGFYYLVRSRKSCGPATYGFSSSGAERLPLAACP